MPDNFYIKVPRPDSIDIFKKWIGEITDIVGVEPLSKILYDVVRVRKETVRTLITNIYIVSITDIVELTSEFKGLNAIVTMSMWNSYSKDAKEHAKSLGVGLFVFKEFMGALHYEGDKFLEYVPPDSKSN